MQRRFRQVDVFGSAPYRGNPLAVVLDGDGLSDDEMRRIANWTNLSETTFLQPPSDPSADYRVRIFTPSAELPFAGHPTLGSCHAWLETGGTSQDDDIVVQECGAGLVRVRRDGDLLAFAAPPLLRSGPADAAARARVVHLLGGVEPVDVAWVDNGPGWLAARLASADEVLGLAPPDFADERDIKLGVVAPAPPGSDFDYEVRAFFPGPGGPEDPVTGSLNASLAQWIMGADPTTTGYRVRQGTALGRDGRVLLERQSDGTIWVAGTTTTCVAGTIDV